MADLTAYLRASVVAFTASLLLGCNGTIGPDASENSLSQQDLSGQTQSPNLVVLFVDDLAWLDVGHRSEFIETPNIDALRNQSMSFERAYASAPVCSPSRVGLITGQYPARHDFVRHIGAGGLDADGNVNFDKKLHYSDDPFSYLPEDPANMPSRNWLPLEAVTVAERLKPVGYHTAFVGKWHIGHEPYYPIHQGFDEQYGVTNFGSPKAGYYPPYWKVKTGNYEDAGPDDYLTGQLTDDAISIIQASQDRDQPLFLSLWYYNVHKPIGGRRDLTEKYLARGIDQEQAEYASMVEAVDESVGRIVEALEVAEMTENTILVFTSDQGGFFERAPLTGKKNDGLALFEGGAKVPLYIRWPGHFPEGSSAHVPVSLLDVAPTLLEPAGAELSDLDGVNLMAWASNPEAQRKPVIMYRHYEDRYAAIVDGDWKLIASVRGQHELYNVVTDISEVNNVASDYPERVADMLAVLEAWKETHSIRRF